MAIAMASTLNSTESGNCSNRKVYYASKENVLQVGQATINTKTLLCSRQVSKIQYILVAAVANCQTAAKYSYFGC